MGHADAAGKTHDPEVGQMSSLASTEAPFEFGRELRKVRSAYNANYRSWPNCDMWGADPLYDKG